MKNFILVFLFLNMLLGFLNPAIASTTKEFTFHSPVFFEDGFIPRKFTCQGKNINPPFIIENIPPGTKRLVLIVEDVDSPVGVWVHWGVFNIHPLDAIEENSIPGQQIINDFRRKDYGGPCPIEGTHRYAFTLYALDKYVLLDEDSTIEDLDFQMDGHILAQATVLGLYQKE